MHNARKHNFFNVHVDTSNLGSKKAPHSAEPYQYTIGCEYM
jgi:hypothetical protein